MDLLFQYFNKFKKILQISFKARLLNCFSKWDHHRHHQCLVQAILWLATKFMFLHSKLSWTKLLSKLHFFRSTIFTFIYVFFFRMPFFLLGHQRAWKIHFFAVIGGLCWTWANHLEWVFLNLSMVDIVHKCPRMCLFFYYFIHSFITHSSQDSQHSYLCYFHYMNVLYSSLLAFFFICHNWYVN